MVVNAGELKKANIQGGVREIVRRYSSQLGHVFKFPAKFIRGEKHQMTLIQLIFTFKKGNNYNPKVLHELGYLFLQGLNINSSS